MNKPDKNRLQTWKNFADPDFKLPPADACLICGRSIEQAGGKRLAAAGKMGISIGERKCKSWGHYNFPSRTVRLSDEPDFFVVLKAEDAVWSEAAMARSREEFLQDRHPWFCQVCGERACRICGSPIAYPMAADVLHDDGSIGHAAIFPFDPGCVNPDCENHKEFEKNRKAPRSPSETAKGGVL